MWVGVTMVSTCASQVEGRSGKEEKMGYVPEDAICDMYVLW